MAPARRSILFVCTGNLCRSPMAAGLAQHLLAQMGANLWEVRSAGTNALDGSPPTPSAIQVLAERGIDISEHRAHQVTQVDLDQAQLVLTMTAAHRQALISQFPEQRSKIELLSEWAGGSGDVEDPMGWRTPEAYRTCADRIEMLLRAGLNRSLHAASATQSRPAP